MLSNNLNKRKARSKYSVKEMEDTKFSEFQPKINEVNSYKKSALSDKEINYIDLESSSMMPLFIHNNNSCPKEIGVSYTDQQVFIKGFYEAFLIDESEVAPKATTHSVPLIKNIKSSSKSELDSKIRQNLITPCESILKYKPDSEKQKLNINDESIIIRNNQIFDKLINKKEEKSQDDQLFQNQHNILSRYSFKKLHTNQNACSQSIKNSLFYYGKLPKSKSDNSITNYRNSYKKNLNTLHNDTDQETSNLQERKMNNIMN